MKTRGLQRHQHRGLAGREHPCTLSGLRLPPHHAPSCLWHPPYPEGSARCKGQGSVLEFSSCCQTRVSG